LSTKILRRIVPWLLAAGLLVGCANAIGNGNDNQNVTPSGGGHPGQALVSGGTVMTSSSYRLVLTTGQSPGGNGIFTSNSYRLQGGVVGATQ